MKNKMLLIILAGGLMFSMSACSGGNGDGNDTVQEQQVEENETPDSTAQDNSAENTENQADAESTDDIGGSDILVVYFTYGENADLPEGVDASASASIQVYDGETTGNTGLVARMISEDTGADIFSIRTVDLYPDNYDDTIDQGREEQRQDARPELADHIEDISQYNTIFLGYPNWWGDMPMAVYSFLDEYDLSGKTVIPFVTSGGSRFSGTVEAIESAEPEADVLEGIAVSDSEAAGAQGEVEAWLEEIGY